jgi:phage shock protein PspC (stress-responsive transcriptional regulator)
MGTETRLLRRSRSDRTLAGVCGGLGAYFEIHAAIFRVAFVVLTLLGGAGIPIYVAAILVMPDEGREDSIATAVLRARRDRPLALIALGLLALVAGSLLASVTLPRGDVWFVLLVAGGVLMWVTFGVAKEGAPTWRRRLGIAAGSLLSLLLVALAISVAVIDVHLNHGIEGRHHVVTSPQQLPDAYRLGAGELTIDLRSIRLPAGETRVEARVDLGALQVTVPDDVVVRAHARAKLGRVDVLGDVVEGADVETRRDGGGARVLVLDARVGVGSVLIRTVR